MDPLDHLPFDDDEPDPLEGLDRPTDLEVVGFCSLLLLAAGFAVFLAAMIFVPR